MTETVKANTATCDNADCSEQGHQKTITIELRAGESVLCGECQQPCTVTSE